MYCIIDNRTEAAVIGSAGPLLFASFAAAWRHLDNLNTLTGEMRWYAEKTMNIQTDTEIAKLARLRDAFAAFEEARDEAIQCQREYEAEPLHSRIMGCVNRATEWTWGRGMLIGGLIVLIFSGGLRTIIQCLTGGN